MLSMTREERLARTLVELADTLVDDFDVVELLALLAERSVELLEVSAAGLVLADNAGALQHMVSTGEATQLVELFQVERDEGPCVDCFRTGEAAIADDLSEAAGRWPAFAPVALDKGFRAAHAFPLRLRGRILGALNLFSAEPGRLTPADVSAGQAMADVAAIALCQLWAMRDAQVVTEQLQHALESRIVIEQAKGMLAERAAMGVDQAFSALRGYARTTKRRLVDVSGEVVSGALPMDQVLSASHPGGSRGSEGRRAG
jgi:GAF domain-containing protein